MSASTSGESRPRLTVVALGDTGAGKTTLAQALVTVLSAKYGPLPAEDPGGPTAGRVLAYGTDRYRYRHIDAPAGRIGELLASGSPRPDGLLLVVSAVDGTGDHLTAQLEVARDVASAEGGQLPPVVVYLTGCENCDDDDLQAQVENHIRADLLDCGFPGDEAVFVRGSGLLASRGDTGPYGRDTVHALAEALDEVLAPRG
ncbi:GTP-binding protein [Kitasatospora purpeofusca]|uniref:GTP-binding protein n=1 Tax=Kitasatospora purpeofusca TaxID=67352 RepID=UPI0036CCE21E